MDSRFLRRKESSVEWRGSMMESQQMEKNPAGLLAVILCLGFMCVGISLKEGLPHGRTFKLRAGQCQIQSLDRTHTAGGTTGEVREGGNSGETVSRRPVSNLTHTVRMCFRTGGTEASVV